jgi:hypothetical protein
MNDWLQEWERWIETVSDEVADWWVEVEAIAEDWATETEQWWEETAAQLQTTLSEEFQVDLDEIAQECDRAIADWFAFWFAPNSPGSPDATDEDLMDQLTPKQDATPTHHPVCLGCRHYHGRLYHNVLLVCAMHPYGAPGSTCPDWESDTEPPDCS